MVKLEQRLGIDKVEAEKLYTVSELLQYIPLSKSGLYGMLKNYDVPCIKLKGRSLYLGKDFLKFLEECRE